MGHSLELTGCVTVRPGLLLAIVESLPLAAVIVTSGITVQGGQCKIMESRFDVHTFAAASRFASPCSVATVPTAATRRCTSCVRWETATHTTMVRTVAATTMMMTEGNVPHSVHAAVARSAAAEVQCTLAQLSKPPHQQLSATGKHKVLSVTVKDNTRQPSK